MTKYFIVLLTVLLFACGHHNTSTKVSTSENTPNLKDSLQNFSITKATITDYIKARKSYKNHILFDTAIYKKRNGKIKLPTESLWRPFVIYTDTLLNSDYDGIREYHYIGKYDNLGYYIVGAQFYENYECFLIDKRTGNRITLWNDPEMSPNNLYLANLSLPYGMEGLPNGIQIWHIQKEPNNQSEPIIIEKYLELDQQIWVPCEFTWETDNSLLLKVTSIKKYLNKNGKPNDIECNILRFILN